MRVRSNNPSTNDWTFGKGASNYLQGNLAVGQLIKTRVLSFLGDCFFDTTTGIDWFQFLGGKNVIQLNLAISSTILNTPNVTGIIQFNVNLNHITRLFSVSYTVQTTYSITGDIFEYDISNLLPD